MYKPKKNNEKIRIKTNYQRVNLKVTENADFTTSAKIIKLLKAAQKLIEDNIENAENIDLEEMGQQIDGMIDELNSGFEIYDED